MSPASFLTLDWARDSGAVEGEPVDLIRIAVVRALNVVVLAAIVFVVAWSSLNFTRYTGFIASVWLANAIVAAALMRSRKDRWGELVAASLIANLAAHFVIGDAIGMSVALSALKVAEVLIVVIVMNRRFGDDISLNELKPLGLFLLVAGLVAPLVTAAGVGSYFLLAGGSSVAAIVGIWLTSHALGLITLTPLLLAIPGNLDPLRATAAVTAERLAIILVAGAIAVAVYSQTAPLQWAIIPLLVLAALRLPPCGAAMTVAMVATIAVAFTTSGLGPVAASNLDAATQILILQAFVATTVLVTLPVSALIGQRDRLLAVVTIARDEARAAAEAKSNFLATMSHEIRTPMTGLLGMIELLRGDPTPDDSQRYFATLNQSATLLRTVLDDILDFSKLESGNVVLEQLDFSVAELAQSTLNLFASAASQKGLLLSMQCDCPPDEYVRGDPTRVQQVMSNLINNAIKFTERGRIRVTIRSTDLDLVMRQIRVEVTDTGVGIAPDHLDRLFQPFIQADASTSRRFGGTGLGLAISRWLIAAMGGTIGVESQPREGSTFWFEVPLQQGLGPEWHAPPIAVEQAVRSLDVLVAEDNPVNQLLIEAILRRLGHRSTIVKNGRLAVEAAATTRFDCILMDMQMPEMDGMAATRAIRASEGPCASIPVIALTADASAERRRFYDNVGLTDFMTKPIDQLALAARLAAIAGVDHAMPTKHFHNMRPLTELPLIDTTNLNQLCAVIGSTSFDGLLDLLQIEMAERPAAIRLAILHRDDVRARREAHSLKGATISIGAMALGQAAAMIESAPDLEAMSDALPMLDRQTRRTREAIEQLIPRTYPTREAS